MASRIKGGSKKFRSGNKVVITRGKKRSASEVAAREKARFKSGKSSMNVFADKTTTTTTVYTSQAKPEFVRVGNKAIAEQQSSKPSFQETATNIIAQRSSVSKHNFDSRVIKTPTNQETVIVSRPVRFASGVLRSDLPSLSEVRASDVKAKPTVFSSFTGGFGEGFTFQELDISKTSKPTFREVGQVAGAVAGIFASSTAFDEVVASGVTAVRTNIFNRRLAVMSAKDVDSAFIFEGKGFSAVSPEGVVLPEKQTVLSTDFKPSKVFSESVDYSIQTGLPREAEVLTFESGETLTRAVPTAQEVARTRRITFESEKLGSEISGSQTGLSSFNVNGFNPEPFVELSIPKDNFRAVATRQFSIGKKGSVSLVEPSFTRGSSSFDLFDDGSRLAGFGNVPKGSLSEGVEIGGSIVSKGNTFRLPIGLSGVAVGSVLSARELNKFDSRVNLREFSGLKSISSVSSATGLKSDLGVTSVSKSLFGSPTNSILSSASKSKVSTIPSGFGSPVSSFGGASVPPVGLPFIPIPKFSFKIKPIGSKHLGMVVARRGKREFTPTFTAANLGLKASKTAFRSGLTLRGKK